MTAHRPHPKRFDLCTVCAGSAASLTTHCPGKRLSYLQLMRVQFGKADFVNGQWVEIVNHLTAKTAEAAA